jgi:hypothetical protein
LRQRVIHTRTHTLARAHIHTRNRIARGVPLTLGSVERSVERLVECLVEYIQRRLVRQHAWRRERQIKPSQSDGWRGKRWTTLKSAEWRTHPMNCGREGSCPQECKRGDGSVRPQTFACALQLTTARGSVAMSCVCVCVCVWRENGWTTLIEVVATTRPSV